MPRLGAERRAVEDDPQAEQEAERSREEGRNLFRERPAPTARQALQRHGQDIEADQDDQEQETANISHAAG